MARGRRILPLRAPLISAALFLCTPFSQVYAGPLEVNLLAPAKSAQLESSVRNANQNNEEFFVVEAMATDGGQCGSTLDDETGRQTPQLSICASQEVTRSLKLKTKEFETVAGTVEVSVGIGKLATSQALTVERIQNPAFEFSETNTAATVGFIDRLFEGRITLSTDVSWAQGELTWIDAGHGGPTFSATEKAGAARWHRFEARLVDTPELRWLANGELASVDEEYVANAGGRPKQALSIPGERARLWSQFKVWDTALSASLETFSNRSLDRETERLTFEWNDIDISITKWRIDRISPMQPSASPLSSEDTKSISFETMPELLLREVVAEGGLLAAVVPELVSVDLETGRQIYPLAGGADNLLFEFQVLLNWSGRLGETTTLYWRNEESAELVATPGSIEQLFDVTHTIKRGDLRLGVGASVFDISELSFNDTYVLANLSLAYTPKSGPRINFRLGHSRDEFALDEAGDPWSQRSMSYNLSASVDLSNYVQKTLDRPDLNLKAEYRRRLDDHRTTDAPDRQKDDEAFLLSFDTSL